MIAVSRVALASMYIFCTLVELSGAAWSATSSNQSSLSWSVLCSLLARIEPRGHLGTNCSLEGRDLERPFIRTSIALKNECPSCSYPWKDANQLVKEVGCFAPSPQARLIFDLHFQLVMHDATHHITLEDAQENVKFPFTTVRRPWLHKISAA